MCSFILLAIKYGNCTFATHLKNKLTADWEKVLFGIGNGSEYIAPLGTDDKASKNNMHNILHMRSCHTENSMHSKQMADKGDLSWVQ